MAFRTPDFQDGTKRGFGPKLLLTGLYRKRWLILASFFGILAAVAAGTALAPKIYVSEARLLLQTGRAETVITPSEEENATIKPEIDEQVLNTEIEILRSTTLLKEVVKRAGIDQLRTESPEAPADEEARRLAGVELIRKGLSVRGVPKSNVIQVRFEAEDPEFAARVVNQLCEAYLEKHLEIRENPGIFEFYRRQAEMLRDSLQSMQVALQAFKQEHKLIDPESERQTLLKQIAGYEQELETARSEYFELQRSVSYLEKQLQEEPKRIQKQVTTIQNALLTSMTRELDSLQTAYTRIRRLGGDSTLPREERARVMQQARTIKARIAQVEETLMRSSQGPAQELTLNINRSLQQIADDLTRARARMLGLRARQASLSITLNQLRQKVKELDQAILTHSALVRRWEIAQNNYFQYVKKQEEARLAEALDRQKVANVAILDPAAVPLVPARPNIKLNLILGAFLGVILSLVIGFVAAMMDDRLYETHDVVNATGMPVLATISDSAFMGGIVNNEEVPLLESDDDFDRRLKQPDIPRLREPDNE